MSKFQTKGVAAILLAFACLTAFQGAYGQSLVLREVEAAAFLAPDPALNTNIQRFLVNGPYTPGLHPEHEARVPYGRFARLLFSLAALRLADEGKLALDAPLHTLLPDLVEERIFEPALTPRHLMAEVAGYAVPPWYRNSDPAALPVPDARDGLAPYLLKLRLAGRMYHDDVVAGALLVELVARLAGVPALDALDRLVVIPLGVARGQLSLGSAPGPAPFRPILDLQGPRDLIVAVARQLVDRPRTPLIRAPHHSLLVDQSTWRLHPLSLTRMLGLEQRLSRGHRMLTLGGPGCETGVALAAWPAQGLSFIEIRIGAPRETCTDRFHRDVARVARNHIPPGSLTRVAEAANLRQPKSLAGFYVRETLPRADLATRLNRIHTEIFFLKPERSSPDFALRRAGQSRHFRPVAPLVYNTGTPLPETLTISPIGNHGYLYGDDGTLYRFIGLLGDERLVLAPLPWMMILMVSGGLHMLNRKSRAWRVMGRNALFGVLLFAGGLVLEIHYWDDALYALEAPWLVFAWRLVLNTGLALILSVTLYGLYFARRKEEMPVGPWLFPVALHLTLLTAGSLILFLLTVAWGIAGELWPL